MHRISSQIISTALYLLCGSLLSSCSHDSGGNGGGSHVDQTIMDAPLVKGYWTLSSAIDEKGNESYFEAGKKTRNYDDLRGVPLGMKFDGESQVVLYGEDKYDSGVVLYSYSSSDKRIVLSVPKKSSDMEMIVDSISADRIVISKYRMRYKVIQTQLTFVKSSLDGPSADDYDQPEALRNLPKTSYSSKDLFGNWQITGISTENGKFIPFSGISSPWPVTQIRLGADGKAGIYTSNVKSVERMKSLNLPITQLLTNYYFSSADQRVVMGNSHELSNVEFTIDSVDSSNLVMGVFKIHQATAAPDADGRKNHDISDSEPFSGSYLNTYQIHFKKVSDAEMLYSQFANKVDGLSADFDHSWDQSVLRLRAASAYFRNEDGLQIYNDQPPCVLANGILTYEAHETVKATDYSGFPSGVSAAVNRQKDVRLSIKVGEFDRTPLNSSFLLKKMTDGIQVELHQARTGQTPEDSEKLKDKWTEYAVKSDENGCVVTLTPGYLNRLEAEISCNVGPQSQGDKLQDYVSLSLVCEY